MSIIQTHKSENTLQVKVLNNFNLQTKNKIESRLTREIDKLEIDLSGSKLLDSEAVIFMYKWDKSDKELKLINPPEILFEILEILELENVWKPDIVSTNKN